MDIATGPGGLRQTPLSTLCSLSSENRAPPSALRPPSDLCRLPSIVSPQSSGFPLTSKKGFININLIKIMNYNPY